MAYFPFMIEVGGHKALVVGAGQSAKDKIRMLTDFGALVTVVAPVISADVVKQGKNIKIERRVYRPGETKGYEIVVAATDNPAVNKQVAHDAARFGAICSVAEDPGRGGFIFPQIIKRNSYSVAVCTDGMDGELALKLKEKIERSVPEKADEIAALFSRARKELDERKCEDQAEAEKSRTRLADFAEMSGAEALDNSARAKDAGSAAEEITTDDRAAENRSYADGSDTERAVSQAAGPADALSGIHQGNDPDMVRQAEEHEEGSAIRVGALSDRLSQVRAAQVISRLEAEGYSCSRVMLESPGTAHYGISAEESIEKATIKNAEDALLSFEADIVVKGAGEIPYRLPEGVIISACLPREDARDMLVTRKGTGDNEIEVIETDRPSRKVQIEKFLKTGEARVSTEGIQAIVNRLKSGETDAAVLSASDMDRLRISQDEDLDCVRIEVDKSLPPACQGLTAIETRATGKAHDAAALLSDDISMQSMKAERAFMKEQASSDGEETAAYSAVNGGMLFIKAMKRSGARCVYRSAMGAPEESEQAGEELALKF